MLLKLKEIGECYRRAAEARERASAAEDMTVREGFLDRERHWLVMAHRYAISELQRPSPAPTRKTSSAQSLEAADGT